MKRESEVPLRTATEDNRMTEWQETHPAYGAIGVSRVSGGIHLHGSSLQHNGFIELTVSRAVRRGDAYHEHLYPRETLIKVRMTDVQFVALVSRQNGPDIPCTLSVVRTGDIEHLPEIAPQPKPAEVLENISREVHERLNRQARERADMIRQLAASLPKGKRETLEKELDLMMEHLTANANYAMEVMTKRKDRLVMESQVEIEATVSAAVNKLGLHTVEQLGAVLAADPAQAFKLLGHDSEG